MYMVALVPFQVQGLINKRNLHVSERDKNSFNDVYLKINSIKILFLCLQSVLKRNIKYKLHFFLEKKSNRMPVF